MERWKQIQAAAVLGIAAAGVGLVANMNPWAIRLLFFLILVMGIAVFVWADRKRREETDRGQLIQVLNHHRHDWMNDLQVLFGYIRLGKQDNLVEYMDKIKTKILHESFLAKLGHPALIAYFLKHRIGKQAFLLELELEEDIDLRQLRIPAARMYRLITGVTESFNHTAMLSSGEPNVLSIGFSREEGELMIDFVYSGAARWETLSKEIRSVLRKTKVLEAVREEKYGDEQAIIALALPFHA